MSIQHTRNLPPNVGRAARQMAGEGARQAAPWVQRLAKFGYAAKGVVYGLVGLLALEAAFGVGGKLTDTRGVLHTIAAQPYGPWVLGAVALGLFGYTVWRFVQAALDPEEKTEGEGARGWLRRVGCVLSGLAYGGLALTALRLILGAAHGGGSAGNTQAYAARALAEPWGRFAVGAAGAVVIGVAAYQAYSAWKEKFVQNLRTGEMNETERKYVTVLGKVGIAARGVVFALTGWFLVRAAFASNAALARGLDGALASLAEQPFGKLLLVVVAAGLVAYGGYSVAEARWRRVPVGRVATAFDGNGR
jgi:hypothetical protein